MNINNDKKFLNRKRNNNNNYLENNLNSNNNLNEIQNNNYLNISQNNQTQNQILFHNFLIFKIFHLFLQLFRFIICFISDYSYI